jgi:hypothetical protein
MNSFRCAGLALILCASPAASQPETGEVQPDCISVGKVHVGATVEASFLVFEAGVKADIKLDVTTPKFVKVLNKKTEARQFGPGNNFITGLVEIAIDTAAEGEFVGDVSVTLGASTVKVPVRATRRRGFEAIKTSPLAKEILTNSW